MDFWKFFLQKEGDQAWLPLEASNVEILEGRYQLIAQTQAIGQSLAIQIKHQFETNDVVMENRQQLVQTVAESGKVQILKDMYLGLGDWEISCTPAPASSLEDRNNSTPNFTLQIQVLPQDFDLFDDWEFIESQLHADASLLLPEPILTEFDLTAPILLEPVIPSSLSMESAPLPSNIPAAIGHIPAPGTEPPMPTAAELEAMVENRPAATAPMAPAEAAAQPQRAVEVVAEVAVESEPIKPEPIEPEPVEPVIASPLPLRLPAALEINAAIQAQLATQVERNGIDLPVLPKTGRSILLTTSQGMPLPPPLLHPPTGNPPKTIELPTFPVLKAMTLANQQEREAALQRLCLIAVAMSQQKMASVQVASEEATSPVFGERFRQTLNHLVVNQS
jgi:hypothetical protein